VLKLLSILVIACGAVSAQTTNQIPKWASGNLVDSMISELGGNIVVTKAAGGNGTSNVVFFDITGTHATNSTYSFQVHSSKGIAQFGMDSFLDSNGAGILSTTAAGGLILSANNNNAHFRIAPTGDVAILGGSTNSEDPNFRTLTVTLNAAGNNPIGRIFESQNTMTLSNNARFNGATSEWFRDDEQYVADVLEWGVEGISMHIAPPGEGAVNPGGSDWKDLGYLRFRIDTQKASFTNVNVGVGVLLPTAKLQVTDGDVYVQTQGKGIILRATDGSNCFRVTVNNSGTLSTASVTCP